MTEWMKLVKYGDLLIILFLILLSFLPIVLFNNAQQKNLDAQYIAIIRLDHKVLYEIDLTNHKGTEILKVVDEHGDHNTIEIIDDKIHIKSANCTDQVCVRSKAISKPGQTIVCLPHKLVIEIKAASGVVPDDMVISS